MILIKKEVIKMFENVFKGASLESSPVDCGCLVQCTCLSGDVNSIRDDRWEKEANDNFKDFNLIA